MDVYVWIREGEVTCRTVIYRHLSASFDKDGQLLGVEILNAMGVDWEGACTTSWIQPPLKPNDLAGAAGA